METNNSFSPYAIFFLSLKGWAVFDRFTMQPVPKFILWSRHKHSRADVEMIIEHRNHDYLFVQKPRNPDGSYGDKVQI